MVRYLLPMNYRYWLSLLILICSYSPHSFADAEQTEGILRSIISENVGNPLVRRVLLDQAVVSASLATAATIADNFCYVVCVKRMAPRIGIQYKKSLVDALGVRELLKLKIVGSKEYQSILSKYKYRNLAEKCVKKELSKKISWVIRARGANSRQYDSGEYFSLLIKLPADFIEIKSSEVSPDQCYKLQLIEVSKDEIARKNYEPAAEKILEASRYGSFSKGMLMGLYQCYLGDGDISKAKQALEVLDSRFSASLTAEDYYQMGLLAKKAGANEQAFSLYECCKTRLIEAFKEMIVQADCKKAEKLILDAKRYGYLSKGMLVDIYTCYLRGGDLVKGEQALNELENRFSESMIAEDYYRIAEIAEKAGADKQAAYLYKEWEDRIPTGLDLDILKIE